MSISLPLIVQRQPSADQVVLRPEEFDAMVAVLQKVDKGFDEWRQLCAEIAPHKPMEELLSPSSVELLELIERFDRRALHLVAA